MKKILFVTLAIISMAQAARPTDKFAWDMDATDLVTVQSYRYELELDNVIQTTPLTTTCSGTTSPFTCSAPIPPITPSNHTARIRAVDTTGGTPLEGPWSDVLSFNMRATPNKPKDIRIIQ